MDFLTTLRGQLQARITERQAAKAALDAILAAPAAEGRNLNDAETVAFNEARTNVTTIDADIEATEGRIAELAAIEARNREVVANTPANIGGAVIRKEARMYHPGPDSPAFLRDVMNAHTRSDFRAAQRLERHMDEERVERAEYMRGIEQRDVGTSAFAGLTVPQYLTDLVAPKTRTLRPFANVCRSLPLPADGLTVNISRITTGTAVASQSAEAAAVQETDIDDTLLTINVRTIAGQQDLSRQAIDRSTGAERVVVEDLIAAYHEELDRQCLVADGTSGTHLGVKNTAANVAVTYTDASPTGAELLPKLADLTQQIQAATNAGLSHFVMHPRRWWWFATSLSSTFPLVNIGAGFQQVGNLGDTGYNSMPDVLGGKVVIDRNVETTLGAGTEDAIYGINADECFLWEDANAPLMIRAEQTGLANLLVKFVVYGYSAFSAGRYPLATGDITGTGLIAPTF